MSTLPSPKSPKITKIARPLHEFRNLINPFIAFQNFLSTEITTLIFPSGPLDRYVNNHA